MVLSPWGSYQLMEVIAPQVPLTFILSPIPGGEDEGEGVYRGLAEPTNYLGFKPLIQSLSKRC